LPEPPRSWTQLAARAPVNEARARLYERLMDAQERIARACYERGVGHEQILAALDAAEERLSEEERVQDLYLSTLAHYVQALGGRLEVRAVFDGEPVVVHRAPRETPGGSPARES
jgi:hypothetical protein